MRRSLWLPLIVAIGVLTLGASLGPGTWAKAFLTERGKLACETRETLAGKVLNCSTVEETTLWQRLTTKYTYYTPGAGMVRTGR